MFGNKMNAVEKAISKNNAGALIRLCGGKERDISLAAIAGLGKVGGDEASHYLVTLLQSTDADVRIATAHALADIGDMHTKAFLTAQKKKETDPKVIAALSEAMSRIKSY